jgi:hypothetical protein
VCIFSLYGSAMMMHHCLDHGDPEEVEGIVSFSGEHITYTEAGKRMQCVYIPHLVFQSSLDMKNYSFWGFASDDVVPTVGPDAKRLLDNGSVHTDIEVRRVKIPGVGDQFGVFATNDIPALTCLGEYTGVLQVDYYHGSGHSRNHIFDPYGLSYPSVYPNGHMSISGTVN